MPQSNTPRDGHTPAGAAGSSGKAGGQGGSRDVPSHSAATSATAENDSLQEQLRTLRSDIAQISTTVAQLVQGQGGSLKEVAAGAVGAALLFFRAMPERPLRGPGEIEPRMADQPGE